MRKNWKKVLSLVLAAALVLSLNVFTFAAEVSEVEAPADEIAEFVVEDDATSTSSNGTASDNEAAVSDNTVTDSVSAAGLTVTVTYDKNVTYDARKHVVSTDKASGSKNNDVAVKLVVTQSGNVVAEANIKKVKYGFKFNKDATTANKTGKLSAKPKKKDSQAYFTVKVTFQKEFKKANKTAVKELTKTLKKTYFGFIIDKADLADLTYECAPAKYQASAKAKFISKKSAVKGLKFVVSYDKVTKKATKVKYKKVGLKQDTAKKTKDFGFVSISGNNVKISANSAAKNFTGFTIISVNKVK